MPYVSIKISRLYATKLRYFSILYGDIPTIKFDAPTNSIPPKIIINHQEEEWFYMFDFPMKRIKGLMFP